jgi:hypothetical protein
VTALKGSRQKALEKKEKGTSQNNALVPIPPVEPNGISMQVNNDASIPVDEAHDTVDDGEEESESQDKSEGKEKDGMKTEKLKIDLLQVKNISTDPNFLPFGLLSWLLYGPISNSPNVRFEPDTLYAVFCLNRKRRGK